jgi:2-polyprenyl-6-methoxyphenol hydroxylase-like FAD-dependent oxidoreductase
MIQMDGNRVGIVGGSIGGCAAAIVLRRAGFDVTVFERSAGALRDRGHGITFPVETRAELVAENLIDAALPMQPITERFWFARDGDEPLGRLLWRQSMTGATHNWGMLWQNLRDRVADADYHDGSPVTAVEPDADAVTLRFGDATAERFDVVIGADGYRSVVRAAVDPAAEPESSGYLLWRGGYPITELPQPVPDELRHHAVTVVYPGGHAMLMVIPDPQPPGLRLYWAVYCESAAQLSTEIGPAAGDLPTGLGTLLSHHFPPYWAEAIARTKLDNVLVHQVVDLRTSRYHAHRIALIGDAATVARPHTGSGATKAVQDALTLARLCGEHGDWADVLTAYDAQRHPVGAELVELGQRIGRAQVTATPPWTAMTPDNFTEWMHAILAGRRLYLYKIQD